MSYYGSYTVMNGDLPEKLDQFKCDICGEILDESDIRVDDRNNNKDYCPDCAFIAGLITEKEYIDLKCGFPITRATVKDKKIYVTLWRYKKFPWEVRLPESCRRKSK